MTLTDALAAALREHTFAGPNDVAENQAAAILADPAFRESLTAALAADVPRLKSYIRSECASNNLRWRVDDPKAQYDPLVRLSAVYGRIDDWSAGLAAAIVAEMLGGEK